VVIDAGNSRFVPGLYTVTYASDGDARTVDDAAARTGAQRASSVRFHALGLRMRVLTVNPAQGQAFVTQMQHTPGVVRVDQAQPLWYHSGPGRPSLIVPR
ncbi:MAG: hypothetical protein ABR508_02675, partial [Candidatus Baltobacteraceae bacterium]